MSIGKNILELRKKNNLSQEQLAEKLDVARQTISKWELEETSPDIEQSNKISKLFNISLDELVGNKSKEIQEENKIKKLINNILKGLGLLVVLVIIFYLIIFLLNLLFPLFHKTQSGFMIDDVKVSCTLDNKEYLINFGLRVKEDETATEKFLTCDNCPDIIIKDLEMIYSIYNINDITIIYNYEENINNYFKIRQGKCQRQTSYDNN